MQSSKAVFLLVEYNTSVCGSIAARWQGIAIANTACEGLARRRQCIAWSGIHQAHTIMNGTHPQSARLYAAVVAKNAISVRQYRLGSPLQPSLDWSSWPAEERHHVR